MYDYIIMFIYYLHTILSIVNFMFNDQFCESEWVILNGKYFFVVFNTHELLWSNTSSMMQKYHDTK